jgi:nitrite reductase/ring-hydroxylating ferredoxin subunit
MSRHIVASVGDIAPGTCRIMTVKGREIGVFNANHEFFALINRCPHQRAELCRGAILSKLDSAAPGDDRLTRQGEIIRCPWHCWEFDIRTGQSWCDPDSVFARSYAVDIEPGATLAKGPFEAETVPVEVEREYMVITV